MANIYSIWLRSGLSGLTDRLADGLAFVTFAAPLGDLRLSGNAGVRVVHTDQRAQGYANPGGGAGAIPVDVIPLY